MFHIRVALTAFYSVTPVRFSIINIEYSELFRAECLVAANATRNRNCSVSMIIQRHSRAVFVQLRSNVGHFCAPLTKTLSREIFNRMG